MPSNKVTITISGPQGTGKSMLADAIAGLLNEHGIPASNLDDDSVDVALNDALELLEKVSCMPVEVDIVTTNAVAE